MLDRVLHSSVMYPIEYGLIPRTYYLDGDPMDAMVLVSERTYPGVIIEARPIGVMHMIDQGDKDDKILMVAVGDPEYKQVKELEDVPEHLIKEITEFFRTYKVLENKKTEVTGWDGREKAMEEIKESMKLYDEKFKNE